MDLAIEALRWSGLEELRPSLQRLLARRCRDAAELDDVVQETLLRAARYRSKLSEGDRLRGWAMRIAINVLRDRVRRRERWSGTESQGEQLEGAEGREPVPGELEEEVQLRLGSLVVGRDAALEHLRAVLGELRPDDRRVLCSFYGGGRETARTAAECGIAVSLVKVRLFRARQRLLRSLRRRLALAGEAEAAW